MGKKIFSMTQHKAQENWDLVVRMAGDHLPQSMRAIGLRIVNNWAKIASQIRLQFPRTLMHGDLGGDNLFFAASERGKLVSVIDWQLCNRGRGTYDVGTLLGALPTEQRRESETDLLMLYHQMLVENGVKGYSFERCLDDYRLTALDLFCRMVYVIREPRSGEDLERFRANDHKIREVRLPRRCAVILDLEADKLISE